MSEDQPNYLPNTPPKVRPFVPRALRRRNFVVLSDGERCLVVNTGSNLSALWALVQQHGMDPAQCRVLTPSYIEIDQD